MNESNSQKEDLIKINNNIDEEEKFRTINYDEEDSFFHRHKTKIKENKDEINISSQSFSKNKEKSKNNISSYEFQIGNYLIQKTIGRGTFGKVKLGLYIPNKEVVAIKILEKRKLVEKDDEIRVKREFDMLSKFTHPNVIMVTEIFESVDSYYSVMEYCAGGELFNYIVEKKRLSENEASFFYYQIISGLEYIHSLGVVHRDLKPENLLLTKDHLLKIIDFGLSNYFNEDKNELLMTPCGSPCYASPEMVGGKKYNGVKIDIWATGIILFAMLCGYLPFEDKDNDILFKKILECKIEFPDNLSNTTKDLIKKILVVEPEKRITIENIKKHDFYIKGKKIFEEIFTIEKIVFETPKDSKCKLEKDKNEEKNNNILTLDNIKEEKNNNLDLKNYTQELTNNNDILENKENIRKDNNNIYIENNENIKTENNIKDDKKSIDNSKKEKNSKKINKTSDNKRNINNIKKLKEAIDKNNKDLKMKKKENSKKDKTNSKNKKEIKKTIKENKEIKDNKEKKDNNNINKNKQKFDEISTITDIKAKERNTVGTIGSIGSLDNFNKTITQQTNITNLMVNNINYNVNISLEDSKRAYSNENQSIKNNNTINNNTINENNTLNNNNIINNNTISNNKILKIKQQNNINIINKNIKDNGAKIYNYLKIYKQRKKDNKDNKRKNRPNKIKKNIKNYMNNNNLKSEREEASFNIYKYLLNNSNIKRFHTESLFKKLMDKKNNSTFRLKTNITNIIENMNKLKINSFERNIPKTNSKNNNKLTHKNTINYQNIINKFDNCKINNINNKVNLSNKKGININLKNISNKKNDISLHYCFTHNKNIYQFSDKDSKSKLKKIFKKSSKELINKYNKINHNNNNNKFQYNNNFSQLSMEIDLNQIIMKTEPNMNNSRTHSNNKIKINSGQKQKFIKINSNSNMINKRINSNQIYNLNSFRQQLYYRHIKENFASPLKYGNKKTNNNNFHQYRKKQLIKARNSDVNYDSSSSIQKSQKNYSKFNRYNENSFNNQMLERKSKSIENKNNLTTKIEKKNKIFYNKININNKSNNLLTNKNRKKNNSKNFIYKIIDKTPDIKAKIQLKMKNNKTLENLINKNLKIIKKDIINKSKIRYNNYNKNKIKMNYTEINSNNNDNSQSKQSIIKNISNNNSLSLLSKKNDKHFKFDSMKINDIYKNNITKKNKIKIVNLIKKINKENNLNKLGNLILKKKGTISNPSLLQKQIIYISNINKNKKDIKKPLNENRNYFQMKQIKQFINAKNNTQKYKLKQLNE